MAEAGLLSDGMTVLSRRRGREPGRRRPNSPAPALLLTLAVLAATLGGCAGEQQGSAGTDDTAGREVVAATSEMSGDIDAAVQTVEAYWADFFSARAGRFVPVSEVFGYDSADDGNCGGERFTLNNAFFCPAGDFIAYDVNFVSAQYVSIGDAFVFYLIGHEYGHAVQHDLGISHRLTIRHELQADCLSGAYLGDSVRAQSLQIEDGDIDELLASLASVGDQPGVPWYAEGAHGTGDQRTRAFARGYQGSSTGGSSVTDCFEI